MLQKYATKKQLTRQTLNGFNKEDPYKASRQFEVALFKCETGFLISIDKYKSLT
jgi:hypothetical protein